MTPFLRLAKTRQSLSASNRKALPYLALGAGILALGFSALFVRWAAAPGPVMGFYRLSLALLAIPLLGEILHGYQILGGRVVLVDIYMVHRSRSLQNDAEDPADI